MAPAALHAPPGWPHPPRAEVWDGLAGAVAQTIAPHTEADPVAILVQLLVGAGTLIGRGAHFPVEATRHHPNQFCVLVGDSAKARKGSSWDHVAQVLSHAEPAFAKVVHTGLSTGEGLIWAARDHNRDRGEGDHHRRLLVVEPEFVSVLKATGRDHSTLSPVLRAAWDGRPLAILTRTAPVKAAAAHISVIGHITRAELAAHLNMIEAANGFLNRFVFIACRRQQLLPEGGHPDPLAGTGLDRRLGQHLHWAETAGEVTLRDDARPLWHDIYAQLAHQTPLDDLVTALTARAEAHVLRLSMLYALTDGTATISSSHLRSALALFDYATTTLTWATPHTSADPVAERISAATAAHPGGLTRTQIRDLFERNLPAARIDQALQHLAADRRIQQQQVATGGRPAQIWTATPPSPK